MSDDTVTNHRIIKRIDSQGYTHFQYAIVTYKNFGKPEAFIPKIHNYAASVEDMREFAKGMFEATRIKALDERDVIIEEAKR
jgi:hypothetical protein